MHNIIGVCEYMINYLCKSCGNSFPRYNSLQKRCGLCTVNTLHAKKPMKRLGKIGKQWLETRKQWISNNQPDSDGKWACALHISPQCLVRVDIDQLQIDHQKSRSRHPELRFTQSNLQPSCMFCNRQKGSTEL